MDGQSAACPSSILHPPTRPGPCAPWARRSGRAPGAAATPGTCGLPGPTRRPIVRAIRLGCPPGGGPAGPEGSGRKNGDGPAPVPAGPFTQGECLDCHGTRDPALVAQWRAGPHAAKADCVACHGERHGALPLARTGRRLHRLSRGHRRPQLRHLQARGPGAHRPARLDPALESRQLPRPRLRLLSPARGRPRRHHGPGARPAVRDWVCSACHAPRYVREQLAAGDRLADIARLKLARRRASPPVTRTARRRWPTSWRRPTATCATCASAPGISPPTTSGGTVSRPWTAT